MTSEIPSVDPYEAVLADLRAKRDRIDEMIRGLEAIRGPGQPMSPLSAAASPPDYADNASSFLGMSIPEAAKKLLTARRKTLSNGEIAAGLKAGGLMMQSRDPANTIGSVITRRFEQVGDIVKVGRGVWGLAEWYPNRSFKRKATKGENGDTGEARTETSEPAPPSVLRVVEPQN